MALTMNTVMTPQHIPHHTHFAVVEELPPHSAGNVKEFYLIFWRGIVTIWSIICVVVTLGGSRSSPCEKSLQKIESQTPSPSIVSSSTSSVQLTLSKDSSVNNVHPLLKIPSFSFFSWKIYDQFTSKSSKKIKLVLDLDETLISSSQKHSSKHDISIRVNIGGVPSTFFVRKRPHVDAFLEATSEWFELVVFTASLSPYANAVIDQLDPKRRITRRYFRQSCTNKSGSYVKDLQVVCKDLSKVMIIDNSPVAYSCNKENAIPIDDWFGNNEHDQCLVNLLPLLEKLKDSNDVRDCLKSNQVLKTMKPNDKRTMSKSQMSNGF